MLILADRGFTAHSLFAAFAATGAELLWRAKSNATLPVVERYPDGSYRSELVASDDKRARERVLPVRVIEYTVVDPGRPDVQERYRLITTILDPDAAPADELAALYAERWEFETALDELKTHQRGRRVVLRSKTPRRGAPRGLGLPVHPLRAPCPHGDGRRRPRHRPRPGQLHPCPARGPPQRARRAGHRRPRPTVALPTTIAEICRELVPRRRVRAAARVVKRKMSNYGVKRAEHRNWPRPIRRPAEAVHVLAQPP